MRHNKYSVIHISSTMEYRTIYIVVEDKFMAMPNMLWAEIHKEVPYSESDHGAI